MIILYVACGFGNKRSLVWNAGGFAVGFAGVGPWRGFVGVARVGVWAFVPVLVGVRSRVRLASGVGMEDGRRVGLISG